MRPPERPWLIPVRFDECEIPDRDIGGGRTLTSIQRADLFYDQYDEGAERLVITIMRLLEQTMKNATEREISTLVASGGARVLGSTTLAEQRPAHSRLLVVGGEIGDQIMAVLKGGYDCTLIKSIQAWSEWRDRGLGEYGGALVNLHVGSGDDAFGIPIVMHLRDATQIPAALVTNNLRSTPFSELRRMQAEYRLVDILMTDSTDRWFQDLLATARLLVGTDEESRRHRLSYWVEAIEYKVTREAMNPEGDQLAPHRLRACQKAASQARDIIKFGSLDEAQRQVDNLCSMYS